MKIGSEVLVCEKKFVFFHGHDQIKLHTGLILDVTASFSLFTTIHLLHL